MENSLIDTNNDDCNIYLPNRRKPPLSKMRKNLSKSARKKREIQAKHKANVNKS